MDRSPTNGFRLVVLQDDAVVAARARRALAVGSRNDPGDPETVSDEVFDVYERLYAYDPVPLRASIDDVSTTRDWTREHITFDAAYDNERMGLYLFLPTDGSPPYQPVLFWPGASATDLASVDDYPAELDFVLKNGRAVALPVFKKTFERRDGRPVPFQATLEDRDLVVQWVKDARRSIDYLETRPDIEQGHVAFFGHSWGGSYGPVLLGVEPRIRVAVLLVAGVMPREWGGIPEVYTANFLPRIDIPLLLLSGEHDPVTGMERARLLFALLGTAEADKRHVIEPGGHFVPRASLIRESLSWLDRYLGPTSWPASSVNGMKREGVG